MKYDVNIGDIIKRTRQSWETWDVPSLGRIMQIVGEDYQNNTDVKSYIIVCLFDPFALYAVGEKTSYPVADLKNRYNLVKPKKKKK